MPSPNRRLNSWKEIAEYLDHGLTTVRRWEQERGLPVRRVPGGSRSAVFALTDEIDSWLLDSDSTHDSVPVPSPPGPNGQPGVPEPISPPRWRTRMLVSAAIFLSLLAIAALILYGRYAVPLPAPRVIRFTQLTNDGEVKMGPLVTEGVRLYFTEGTGIIQIPVTGGRPVPLLPNWSGRLLDLAPGGAEILTMSARVPTGVETPLYLLPLAGGPLRKTGLLANLGALSPNGEEVAYVNNSGLYTAKTDGTGSRWIASLKETVWAIRWSPDGTRLRLGMGEQDRLSLWQVVAGGNGLQPVLPRLMAGRSASMGNWTRDGRYFLFHVDTDAGRDLWALPEMPGNRYDPDRRAVQLTNGPISFDAPVATQDGKKLFVIGRFSRGELMRLDEKSRRFVPWLPGLSADGLSFSADGESVAYTLYPEQSLWRSRADGNERVQLTFSGLEVLLPRWSPDGQRIAFMGRPPGERGSWNIYIIPAGGGSPEALLPTDADHAGPSWSPDGKSLAFAGAPWLKRFARDSTAIHLIDPQSRQVSVLPGSEGLWAPKWSPDGGYILAETVDSLELKLFDFRTRQWRTLTRTAETIGYPCWSHSGDSVYFNTDAPAIDRVLLQSGKVDRVLSLAGLKTVGVLGHWFGLMPDDTPIVLRDTSMQEIYALDVDLP